MQVHDFIACIYKSTDLYVERSTCSCMVVLSANRHGINSLLTTIQLRMRPSYAKVCYTIIIAPEINAMVSRRTITSSALVIIHQYHYICMDQVFKLARVQFTTDIVVSAKT